MLVFIAYFFLRILWLWFNAGVVEAPRCFEHCFWSGRKTFRGAWLETCSNSVKKSSKKIENTPRTWKLKKNLWVLFGSVFIAFFSTHPMTLIQRALEIPGLEEHFQYQIQCEKTKKSKKKSKTIFFDFFLKIQKFSNFFQKCLKNFLRVQWP